MTMNEQNYARTLELMKREMPRLVNGFTGLQQTATAEAALDARTKSLTALAIAVLRGSEDSITRHAADALDAGATESEMLEAVGMSLLLGGEPVSFHASRAYAIIEQVIAGAA